MIRSLVFFGTGDIGRPTLSALSEHFTVREVICAPEKQRGRGQKHSPDAMELHAEELGLPVSTPEDLTSFSPQRADIGIVFSYGKLLPTSILRHFPLGCINVHPSLLPSWRGAAPIEWSLLSGDKKTGITLFRMTEEMDAGPIVAKTSIYLAGWMHRNNVKQLVANMVPPFLIHTLHDLPPARSQKPSWASYAPKFSKNAFIIHWSRPAWETERQIRALYPRVHTRADGKTLRILRAHAYPGERSGRAGQCLSVKPWRIACGGGVLEIRAVHPEGKRPMGAEDYLRGRKSAPILE